MPRELKANPNVVEMEYAVRGPIPQRAAELRREGRRIIPCNIGNPQALGQAPLTFPRQVMALLEQPDRLGLERRRAEAGAEGAYPLDAVDRAAEMLARLETGLGAYTESAGPAFVREAVAAFIDRRDRGGEDFVPADPDSIFITDGASEAVKRVLEILIAGPEDGVMIPIPQYPLYSAVIRRCGGRQVGYYPDEDRGWTLEREELDRAWEEAVAAGTRLKAIVVINPGNPTGAVLPESSVREVIDFAEEHDLVVIADEVYQDNTYGRPFVSFARVLGRRPVPLCSLHSVSKGFFGECGRRGGYLEVRNPPALAGTRTTFGELLIKQASVSLCSNTAGQAMVELMVRPPAPGDPSHERFAAERDHVLGELAAKAGRLKEAFAEMEGVSCPGEIGAMYLFPRLGVLPEGTGDFEYCLRLLEETGLCTVNGAGFGQAPGTHHLRIAFLPPSELLEEVLPHWVEMHRSYLAAGHKVRG
ncbi:MAG: aminotransferase class I/II-fold pyridoxal phosphate-dependent enzyme [Planctomycetota bacterium]|nr:MAG: aminotransferase class I/II-fold pyridoxal phosphate-dependent enzyme [Planctomycetota bacterium]